MKYNCVRLLLFLTYLPLDYTIVTGKDKRRVGGNTQHRPQVQVIAPIHYILHLTFNGPYPYAGRLVLYLVPSRETDEIRLNIRGALTFPTAATSKKPVGAFAVTNRHRARIPILGVTRSKVAEELTIVLKRPLKRHRMYQLTVRRFRGEMNTDLLSHEAFRYEVMASDNSTNQSHARSSYDAGDPYIISTMFQMENARSAFPCIDDPSRKATLRLCIVHPWDSNAEATTGVASIRKMPDGLTRTCFRPSMVLPTYLFNLAVYRGLDLFEDRITGYFSKAIPFKVIYPGNYSLFRDITCKINPLACEQSNILWEQVPAILYELEKYLYHPIPLEKLTFIVHHLRYRTRWESDGGSLAMENHGLVSYDYTMTDPSTILHETVHQFIGNTITVPTWNEMDFQEGLTTYLSHVLARKVNITRWHSTLVNYVWSAETVLPTSDEGRFENMADVFRDGYSRPSQIFRMTESLIGPQNFRRILHRLIGRYRFRNAGWAEFEQILKENPLPQGERKLRFFHQWHVVGGCPIVIVRTQNIKRNNQEDLPLTITRLDQFIVHRERNSSDNRTMKFQKPWFHLSFDVARFGHENQPTFYTAAKYPVVFYHPDAQAKVLINSHETSLQLTIHHEAAMLNEILRLNPNLEPQNRYNVTIKSDFSAKVPSLADQVLYGMHLNLMPTEQTNGGNTTMSMLVTQACNQTESRWLWRLQKCHLDNLITPDNMINTVNGT